MRIHPRLLAAALLLAAVAAMAPAAGGAEGLFLTWNDCAPAAGSSHDLGWTCDANTGESELFCAFGVAASVDSILGFEIVVDIQHSAAVLPDWWQLAVGGCRCGQLDAEFDFRAFPACADFSLRRANGGVLGYVVGEPRGGAAQARITVAAAWLPEEGYAALSPDSTYYAARLVLGHGLTTSCAGCPGAACLVFNGMRILRQPGAVGGDVELSVPGLDPSNWATWQGGSGANCAAVPVRAVTWGRLKGLYR